MMRTACAESRNHPYMLHIGLDGARAYRLSPPFATVSRTDPARSGVHQQAMRGGYGKRMVRATATAIVGCSISARHVSRELRLVVG